MDKGAIPRKLLRPAEAAEMLGVCRTRAYQLINSGEIPSVRLGKSVRVPVEALDRWIRETTQNEKRGEPERRPTA